MKLNTTSLSLFCPIIAMGILGSSIPAYAVTLAIGDQLVITGDVQFSPLAPAEATILEFADINDVFQPVDSYGNFGVLNTSTGGFEVFETAGAITANYDIRSFDFANFANFPQPPGLQNPPLIPDFTDPFITLTAGLDSTSFFLDNVVFIDTRDIGAGQSQTTVTINGRFVNDDELIAVGSFNATFTEGDNTTGYQGTLTVENDVPPIPEPSTTAGFIALGAVAAIGAVKRTKSTKLN